MFCNCLILLQCWALAPLLAPPRHRDTGANEKRLLTSWWREGKIIQWRGGSGAVEVARRRNCANLHHFCAIFESILHLNLKHKKLEFEKSEGDCWAVGTCDTGDRRRGTGDRETGDCEKGDRETVERET